MMKNFQDPSMDLLDPKVNFVRRCTYLELKALQTVLLEFRNISSICLISLIGSDDSFIQNFTNLFIDLFN